MMDEIRRLNKQHKTHRSHKDLCHLIITARGSEIEPRTSIDLYYQAHFYRLLISII